MQRKLPERQQPPAILLPSLLVSELPAQGGICWVCCSGWGNAVLQIIWGNGYLDLGVLLENPRWIWILEGQFNVQHLQYPSLGDTASIPGVVAPCGMGLMLSIHLLQVRRNSLCWIHWAWSIGSDQPRSDCPQNPAEYFAVVWLIRVLHPPALLVLYKLKIIFYNVWVHAKRQKRKKKCKSFSYK